MNAEKKLMFVLSTQIAPTLMVVSLALVWKGFRKMVIFARVREVSSNVLFSQILE